ncbi:hypothetical protein JCM19274_3185 [Algibacter lectus]|uniref:Uncharacterized protein n=1 Tax=Algibacter lectus TaxID=221126 RepID=A0A090WU54_9FLAO|nr:hypothetical protein JCM19274_3185 [Algibacter lectus]
MALLKSLFRNKWVKLALVGFISVLVFFIGLYISIYLGGFW